MENTSNPDPRKELDGELTGLLTAISIVSKRLATNIARLQQQNLEGNSNG